MPKPPVQAKKLVWRISPSAPKGEWVDPAKAAAPPPKLELPEVSSGSWVTSSFDLLSGSDVIEHPDAMTPELFDELFKPVAGGRKGPAK